MKHYRIHVTGLVQGVWFRKYTLEAALEYRLKGFVKNESNGNVLIEAEGEAANLKQFINWLQTGSPLSKVKEVNCEEGKVKGYATFTISR